MRFQSAGPHDAVRGPSDPGPTRPAPPADHLPHDARQAGGPAEAVDPWASSLPTANPAGFRSVSRAAVRKAAGVRRDCLAFVRGSVAGRPDSYGMSPAAGPPDPSIASPARRLGTRAREGPGGPWASGPDGSDDGCGLRPPAERPRRSLHRPVGSDAARARPPKRGHQADGCDLRRGEVATTVVPFPVPPLRAHTAAPGVAPDDARRLMISTTSP